MKILMVNKFLYPRGGAESYMLKIGVALQSMGHTVEYFGMFDPKNTVGNTLNLYTTNMDFHTSSLSKLWYPFKIIYSLESKRKIKKVIRNFKPDVVHFNNINFQLTPSMMDAANREKVPMVQTVHDYQMVCPNHLFYNEAAGGICEKCLTGSKLNCAKQKCIHGSRIKSILGTLEAWVYKIKGTYKKMNVYICPSRFLEQKLQTGNPLYRGKTAVLCNFVEMPKATTNQPPYNFPYIAFAGRLSYEKGVALLAETARLLPHVQFVVMGDGPQKALLEHIDNVILTGFLSGEALTATIANAQALAVPSVCYENCPLSILEARALGVPAVTMPYGGMAELTKDGVTGILAKQATPQAFAKAITELLSDKQALCEMKAHCLAESKEILTVESYTEKLLELYRSL